MWVPYQEGADAFAETAGELSARLHLDPETGHARFEPLPSPEQLSGFYNGPYVRPGKRLDPAAEYTPAVLEVARGLRAHLQRVAGFGEHFTAHDVGCAYGALTWGLLALGVTSTGSEANREEVRAGNAYCRGALSDKPLAAALAELDYEIDLFTALHVLEHLPDPLAALRDMRARLSRDGVVYICVPNGHSLQAMLGGRRKDPCYNFPGHLQYFTPKSLLAMLHAADLQPVELTTRALPHMEGGVPGLEQLLGAPAALMPDASAWSAACCANLLGYELFVLACRPDNARAVRDPSVAVKAERAYQAFRTRSAFEHGRAEPVPVRRRLVGWLRH